MALQAHGVINISGMPTGTPGFQLDESAFHEIYRLVCLKSLPVAGRSRFASHLALHFPEAAARIDDGDFGILHLEVGALKLETRGAINRRNWDVLRNHFAFVSELMEDGGAELRDALKVSYLGNLFYGETSLNYAKARSLLPRNLAVLLDAVENHYESQVA
ncbi:MAG TPA: hypothetical protein VIU46_07140 [Gallionellaceae bacterium]